MDGIAFNVGGNYVTALFFCGLSAVVALIVVVARARGHGARFWAFSRRLAWLPVVVPLVAYYGVLYWWVFHDQFFVLLREDAHTWRLEYRLPTRIVTIAPRDITAVRLESGTLRTGQMAQVVIHTADGGRYVSAQFAGHRGRQYLAWIDELRQEVR